MQSIEIFIHIIDYYYALIGYISVQMIENNNKKTKIANYNVPILNIFLIQMNLHIFTSNWLQVQR